jgi:transposase
MSQNIHYAT